MSTMKTDNELIAEFMGMKHQIQVGPFGGEYLYVKNPVTKEFEIPKFEISWDWLMPVVEKIKKCGYDDRGFELLKTIDHYLVMVQIADVHMYVVEFIKWYNQQSNG